MTQAPSMARAIMVQQQWPDLCAERCRACGHRLLAYDAAFYDCLPVCTECHRRHQADPDAAYGLAMQLVHRLVHGTWPDGVTDAHT